MSDATINWSMWEVIAVLIGAVGQIGTAVILLIFTMRSNRVTAIKYLGDMVNDWNRLVVESEVNKIALRTLRAPVIDSHTDTIVFTYLNYLHTGFAMHKYKIISESHERELIKNGTAWLLTLGRDKISQYLSCGYDSRFRLRILEEFDNATR